MVSRATVEDWVDVWFVRLNAEPAQLAELSRWLSAEEQARALRFRFDHSRAEFVQSHAALRLLLADFLHCQPQDVEFVLSPKGKPSVAGRSDLSFNMSHTTGMAAFALAYTCQVGVDIELVKDIPDYEGIVEQYFSPVERDQFGSMQVGERNAAFFRGWTRKEAYIKAKGGGLSIPLNEFTVPLGAELAGSPVITNGGDGTTWQLHALDTTEGYVAAIVYSGDIRTVRVHRVVDAADLQSNLR